MNKNTLAVISIKTRHNLESDKYCRDILEILTFCIPELKPEFVGNYEPINHQYQSIDDGIKFWDSSFFWLGKKRSNILGSVTFGSSNILNAIQIEFNFDICEDLKIMDFIFKLGEVIQIDIAYFHCLSTPEIENISYDLQKIIEFGFRIQDLKKGIPIMPWFTIFGDAYINLITETKLISTPAFKTKRFNDKFISIQLTKEINDLIDNYPNFQIARRKATEHLSGFFWGDKSVKTPMEYNEMGNFDGNGLFEKILE